MYQEESNVKLPVETTCQVKEQLSQLQNQPTSDSCMSQPITMKEIEAAIKQLKCKKDQMVSQMKWRDQTPWTCCQENTSWVIHWIMQEWHSFCFMEKATTIPIHKKGKDKKDPNSYRPISLLSFLGELLERAINRRLISFWEEQKYCHHYRLDTRNTEAQKISRPPLPKS